MRSLFQKEIPTFDEIELIAEVMGPMMEAMSPGSRVGTAIIAGISGREQAFRRAP
jgi:hypothetical protein